MRYLVLLLSLLLCMACQPGSGAGQTVAGGIDEDEPLALLQNQVFTPICSQCHFGQQAPLGLRLDSADFAYKNLVNVPAQGNSNYLRVEPFSLERSYIWLKVTGNSLAGQRMPLGLAPLSAQQIGLIENWILDGALPVESSQPVKMVKVEVSQLAQSTRIEMWFNGVIDRNSLTRAFIALKRKNQAELADAFEVKSLETFLLESRSNRLVLGLPKVSGSQNTEIGLLSFNSKLGTWLMDSNGRLIDLDEDGYEGGRFDVWF